jgi:hypothetical protein
MTERRRRRGEVALITLLVSGATVKDAAAKTGLSERTVYRRLQDPAFTEQLEAARLERWARMGDILTAAMLPSAKKLIGLLDSAVPPSVQLGAARTILEQSLKLREHNELEERLAAVEKRCTGLVAPQPGQPSNASIYPAEWKPPPADTG